MCDEACFVYTALLRLEIEKHDSKTGVRENRGRHVSHIFTVSVEKTSLDSLVQQQAFPKPAAPFVAFTICYIKRK